MAVNLKLIARSALVNLVVDSTVQPKAIAHPTDSRLLETARQKLVEAAVKRHPDLRVKATPSFTSCQSGNILVSSQCQGFF